ncbi:hypothetical protein F5H01DRAFT_12138 [Linnemannia elongata]|nr:hypothetical protein F5H01DRAFT_12138 [Linnemannia elongata]
MASRFRVSTERCKFLSIGRSSRVDVTTVAGVTPSFMSPRDTDTKSRVSRQPSPLHPHPPPLHQRSPIPKPSPTPQLMYNSPAIERAANPPTAAAPPTRNPKACLAGHYSIQEQTPASEPTTILLRPQQPKTYSKPPDRHRRHSPERGPGSHRSSCDGGRLPGGTDMLERQFSIASGNRGQSPSEALSSVTRTGGRAQADTRSR